LFVRFPPTLLSLCRQLGGLPAQLRCVKRILKKFFFSCLLPAAILLCAVDQWISWRAAERIHSQMDELQPAEIALLLGTGKYYHHRQNVFFGPRVQAAAKLFRAGKIKQVLVSGNGTPGHRSETEDMKADLLALGVPEEKILLDPWGLRTISSVRHAQSLFPQASFIIVSQRFHIERALFLADALGLSAQGYAAADAPWAWHMKIRMREMGARMYACLELILIRLTLRYQGQQRDSSDGVSPEQSKALSAVAL
jgi:SanA protein